MNDLALRIRMHNYIKTKISVLHYLSENVLLLSGNYDEAIRMFDYTLHIIQIMHKHIYIKGKIYTIYQEMQFCN